jgi:uncharacterized OB-fold protein
MDRFSVERDEASAPFFDAAATGRLFIRRCATCGRHYPPHQSHCVDGDELGWVAAAGQATLVTWAVDHGSALDPVLAAPDGESSVFGTVELAEGPWLSVAIVDADPAALEAGMAMRLCFVTPGDGETVPAFAVRPPDGEGR